MMKRICTALLSVCLLASSAGAEDWPDGRELHCEKALPACYILQMVMMGELTGLATGDSMEQRVAASLLPRLLALTEDDKAHFMAEYPVSEAELSSRLSIAMGYCLWADILSAAPPEDERLANSRVVLHLFLRDAAGAKDVEDRAIIRSMLTEEMIADIAQMNGLTVAFLEYLFYSDDWRILNLETEQQP